MKKSGHKQLYLFFCLSLIGWDYGWAQMPDPVHSIPISKPESVSIDRFSNIYISDSKGNIIQYDNNGIILQKYSPSRPVKITLLESWQAIKIFAFSQDLQQILFLDRFLVPSSAIQKLQDLSMGFIRTATVSIDNNLWLVDDSDLSLKKYDITQQKTVIHSPLNLQLGSSSYDINFIKEYQNHLFINDKNNGILMFDILGNYLRTLPIKNLQYFNFTNDELYYLEEDKIIFYNFYKLQERSFYVSKGYSFILATDKKLFLISSSRLDIINL